MFWCCFLSVIFLSGPSFCVSSVSIDSILFWFVELLTQRSCWFYFQSKQSLFQSSCLFKPLSLSLDSVSKKKKKQWMGWRGGAGPGGGLIGLIGCCNQVFWADRWSRRQEAGLANQPAPISMFCWWMFLCRQQSFVHVDHITFIFFIWFSFD